MSSEVQPVGPVDPAEPAEAVAAAVRAVPGVLDLHGGLLSEVATYLPGRMVRGVRLREPGAEVHVVLAWGAPLEETSAAVRAAAAGVVGLPVDVWVQDVRDPAEQS